MNCSFRALAAFVPGTLALAAVTACGGGGSSGGGDSTTAVTTADAASIDLLIGDAPVDELSSFEIEVLAAHLVRPDNSETDNVLASSRMVDLLDLVSKSALLRVATTEADVYDGVRLVFDPDSVEARDLAGEVVPVQVLTADATAVLDEALELEAAERTRLHLDVDLDESLSEDGSGGYLFDPEVVLTVRDDPELPLDGLHGRIREVKERRGQLVVAIHDPDSDTDIGHLTLEVFDRTLLLDEGKPVTARQFFNTASPGDRFAADGKLMRGGILKASYILLREDRRPEAEVSGLVTDLNSANQQLTLQIRHIERGRSPLKRALRRLGAPNEITVSFDLARILLKGETPRMGTGDDLAIGQRVRIDLGPLASGMPFPAQWIVVDDEGLRFHGTVADGQSIPADFDITLHPRDVAVRAGLVESEDTPVAVLLDGTETIYLKFQGHPELELEQILPGQHLRVTGDYGGTPTEPEVNADSIRVRPGRLDGEVEAWDPVEQSLTVAIDKIGDPFGGDPLDEKVVIHLADGVVVKRDATTVDELFELLEKLTDDDEAEVHVTGIGDGLGDVVAYRVIIDVD